MPNTPSQQAVSDATTTQQATGKIYKVQDNGQAPKGLKAGDQVVTGGGTYTINAVNADGTYSSNLTNREQTTGTYSGEYATIPGEAPATAAAPAQPAWAQTVNPDVDYAALAQQAIQNQDWGAAAVYEDLRNQKIKQQGLEDKYAITNTFASWLEQVSPERRMQLQQGANYAPASGSAAMNLPQNPYPELEKLADQQRLAAFQQQENKIDYATQQGINEAQRVMEDAAPKFQTQRNQNDIDTARALDNSALYAQARGDNGGIGQSQYNEIQAAALKNRQAINTAQVKLSTDTARQIADYRAQGEFEKADALLATTQQYLTQLMSLKQAGAEYALNVVQMQQELDQWQKQFELQVANTTGMYNGQPTYAATKYEEGKLGDVASTLLKMGVMPSDEQLAALGMTKDQAQAYIYALQMQSFSSGGSGGGGSSGRGSGGGGSGSETPTNDSNTTSSNKVLYNGKWVESNVGHEDIDYKDQETVTGSAFATGDVLASISKGVSQKDVTALIEKYKANGWISDDEARRLKYQNSHREETAVRRGGQ